MYKNQKSVLAIVVTYNAENWVDYCFVSLLKSKHKVDIFCIDNASVDNTVSLIEEKYPTVELVKNKINLGFGKANNIGIQEVIERNYDYAFLLNQDARVEPDTIDMLVKIHEKNPDFGVLSPMHRSFNNENLDLNFSKYLLSNNSQIVEDYILGNKIKEVYEIGFVNAALWLVPRTCFIKVGFFDPIFPHYGEDNVFLHRVTKMGLKVGIVPRALGNHVRFKQKSINKKYDFNSYTSRVYVRYLITYKTYSDSILRSKIYICRKIVSDLLNAVIMNNLKSFRARLISFVRFLRIIFSSA